MENDIENLIEELTKARPEMLNEEALKLFNTIMVVLDERDKLRKENKLLKKVDSVVENIDTQKLILKIEEDDYIPKSKIKEKMLGVKIETFETPDDYYYATQILQELMEEK